MRIGVQSPLEVQRPEIYTNSVFEARQYQHHLLMVEMSQDEFAFGYILSRCNLKTTASGNEKK